MVIVFNTMKQQKQKQTYNGKWIRLPATLWELGFI